MLSVQISPPKYCRKSVDPTRRRIVRHPPLALTERLARRSGGIQGSWRSGEADGGGALPGQQAFGRADLWTGGEGGVCAHVCMCMRTRTRKCACACACACACCMCMCMCMHVHAHMHATCAHGHGRKRLPLEVPTDIVWYTIAVEGEYV